MMCPYLPQQFRVQQMWLYQAPSEAFYERMESQLSYKRSSLVAVSSLGFPVPSQTLPQSMPPAGFFAQAVRGQALQFQQGQMLAGQAGRQGSPLISSGLLTMTGTQQSHVSPAGVQPQISGQGQPTKVQGQLADLLSSDSTQQRMEKPNISPVQKQGGKL